MVFMLYNLESEERAKRRKEQSNPLKHTLNKLIQNIDILEKFYSFKDFFQGPTVISSRKFEKFKSSANDDSEHDKE
jgi:CRISPR/Cas system CSM-associated protein Csm2 small subunit